MLTLKYLVDHMNKYNDAVILIGKNSINSFEENDFLTVKNMRRHKNLFWNKYNSLKENIESINHKDLLQQLIYLQLYTGINKIVEFDIAGNYRYSANIDKNVEYIPFYGLYDKYRCQNSKCENEISIYVDKCECGRDIRPDILIPGENFNVDIINKIREAVQHTHTLLLIDMDFREPEVFSLIDIFNIERENNPDEKRIMVTLQDPTIEYDINEYAFSEFLVKDEPSESLKRLVNGFREE